MFDVYKEMKNPAIYEEFFAITIIDMEMTAKYVETQDPLEIVLIGKLLREMLNPNCWLTP